MSNRNEWRKRNKQARNKYRKANYKQTAVQIGKGKHQRKQRDWEQWEIEALFPRIFTDRVLSIFLNRSVQAIQTKRCLLKKQS